MHREVQPLLSSRAINPTIPLQLDVIILKVLSKEPSARYRTADQLGHFAARLYESDPSLKKSNFFMHEGSRAEPSQPLRGCNSLGAALACIST